MTFKRGLLLILALAWLPHAWSAPVRDLEECAAAATSKGRSTYRPAIKRSFIKKYAEKIYVGEEANQRWIDQAMADTGKCLNVMIENAWTKKLNDQIFKNKDFVTALTNFHKEFVIEEMNKQFPRATGSLYSDFKSVRMTVCGEVSQADLAKIQSAYVEANRRFRASPVLSQITRPNDLTGQWFYMGIGRTPDQAALAARYARNGGGPFHLSYFWDQKVRDGLAEKLKNAKDQHAAILRSFGWASIPLDVYTVSRKSATALKLLDALKLLYPGATYTEAQAQMILDFANLADEFSPSMLIAKREILTIHDAPFGALSMDFIGLGAENLEATAQALIEGRDLEEAVRLSRVKEREVTRRFFERKALIAQVVTEFFAGRVSLRFSGDDGVIIPEVEFLLREQLYLLNRLSQLFPRPFMRMAAINKDGAATQASELITHAESIEKKLRGLFNTELGVEVSNDIQIQVFIPDADPRGRSAYLILSLKRNLTAEQKQIVRNTFDSAVTTVMAEIQSAGQNINYRAVDVFAMRPDQRELSD
jgi:predicted RNA-binding protein YlxR (DUF448 family)